MTQRLVVAGNGMVGHRLRRGAARPRRATAAGASSSSARSPAAAYDRVALTSYFDGASADGPRRSVPDGCYDDRGYELHLASR